ALGRFPRSRYPEFTNCSRPKYAGENYKCARKLFDLGNQMLAPFYAFAEDRSWKAKWGEPLRDRPETTYPQRELLGIFWMTYFNAAYVEFFGKDRFSSLPGVEYNASGGATIMLADRPQNVPDGLRDWVAATLGKQSFVELDTKYLLPKRQGRHVLTFEQLRAFDAARENQG
ncbi:MAG: hypothetical protein HZB26_08865, partial [Candidatus Hydrogenedentes bacterium]|nr:hypothetical protein [Candidatus Hydrogenedentota bacterium]